MRGFDAIIVGAGIVGAAIARECARSGLRIAIVEGNVTAGGITAAGMGHLVVMDDSPAQIALTAYSRTLWHEEAPLLPAAVEFERCGTLWVAADDEEMAEVHAKRATYKVAGVETRILDSRALAAEEPNLRPGLAGGLLVPDDAVIYPPAAAGFYLREAIGLGAQCISNRALSAANGHVHLADGTQLSSPCIILATGSHGTLLPQLPIEKRKGHLVITDRYPGFVRHQLVELGYLKSAHKLREDSVAFNIQPRRTGQLLIGSSRQYGAAHAGVDDSILNQMLARAAAYMPALRGLSALRVWTGFRASTRDKLPFIGPAVDFAGDPSLWLAMGFEGLGITDAPGAARILVDAILGRTSAIDRAPYLPARLLSEVGHG